MANEERQENLEEIKKAVAKELKKKNKLTDVEVEKIMKEANENIDFLKVLDEITIPTTGKKVIFVDGKACLVYDSGIFYIEDSIDAKKSKKKITRKQATELYIEYFFRYIMNPAIERKKIMQQVQKVAVKSKKPVEKKKETATKKVTKKVEKEISAKTKTKSKEEYVR